MERHHAGGFPSAAEEAHREPTRMGEVRRGTAEHVHVASDGGATIMTPSRATRSQAGPEPAGGNPT